MRVDLTKTCLLFQIVILLKVIKHIKSELTEISVQTGGATLAPDIVDTINESKA